MQTVLMFLSIFFLRKIDICYFVTFDIFAGQIRYDTDPFSRRSAYRVRQHISNTAGIYIEGLLQVQQSH